MPMLRTQISLPKNLRRRIDKDREANGESLSEYMRKAAQKRLKEKAAREKRLQKLADNFIGSLDLSQHPEWSTKEKVMQWQRDIRREKGI